MILFKSGDAMYTAFGVDLLGREQTSLLAGLQRSVLRNREAAQSGGGLQEEGGMSAFQDDEDRIKRRLREIRDALAGLRAEVVPTDPEHVAIGTEVVLETLPSGEVATYVVVGDGEGAPERGFLSYRAPVAAAILGHQVGEVVAVAYAGVTVRIAGLRQLTSEDLFKTSAERRSPSGRA